MGCVVASAGYSFLRRKSLPCIVRQDVRELGALTRFSRCLRWLLSHKIEVTEHMLMCFKPQPVLIPSYLPFAIGFEKGGMLHMSVCKVKDVAGRKYGAVSLHYRTVSTGQAR
jgi:hypothetical protein